MFSDELSLQNLWADFRTLGLGRPSWLTRAQVGATPATEIFKRGNLRFIKYTAHVDETRTPIVIVPSLINRHYILDLLPKRSLVEAFLEAGFPVYLMAWGHPPAEDRFLTVEQLFEQRILKAIQLATKASPTGKVHLVGQCLGGTFATIAALLKPECIASLSLLTTPINFEQTGLLGAWANAPGFDVDALVAAYGNVPASLLQTSFRFLKPSMPLTKWTKFLAKRKDEEFLVNFFAMEMWANDAISFPGLCYKFLIEELYRKNKLAKSELELLGRRLSLGRLPFPVMDAMAADDHIVPIGTRLPIDGATTYNLAGGHIGAIISSGARKNFWPKWIQWLGEQNKPVFTT